MDRYLCPPCLLKAHASATTWPVALLATGTQSMEEISQPNMLDSCRRSSCREEEKRHRAELRRRRSRRSRRTGRRRGRRLLTALMSCSVMDFFFSTT